MIAEPRALARALRERREMTQFVRAAITAALGLALATGSAPARSAPGVQSFSPQGTTRDVRQVTARFAAPMVAFGDPRAEAPFTVSCPAPGRGRWVDTRIWVHEFESPLPAGLACSFVTRPGLMNARGEAVDAQTFRFDTGGPAVRRSLPAEDDTIDESQAFVLVLDGAVDARSVAERGWCAVEGIVERLPLVVVAGDARAKLVAEQRARIVDALGRESDTGAALTPAEDAQVAVVRCGRNLPPEATVKLVWGAGIRSATGLATREDQSLAFRVRGDFTARIGCERVGRDAGCVPMLPLSVLFTAPVSRDLASRFTLTAPDGRVWKPTLEGAAGPVDTVRFKGPFPEQTALKLGVPDKLVDDAGRPLANRSALDRPVTIDEDPPLVKFGASFGILEAAASPALPVTIRNVEPTLRGTVADALIVQPPTRGTVARVDGGSDAALLHWLGRVLRGPDWRPLRPGDPDPKPGERPLLEGASGVQTTSIELPIPGGGRAFEVVGIPFQRTGFHVVELASPRLGRVLNESAKPYHVYSSALVTELAVHFKRGRESSLAWVTRLADGKPVAGARVAVNDCLGRALWSGTTDASGLARIDDALAVKPGREEGCIIGRDQLFVTARLGEDVSFMLTSWNDGIGRYAFGLPRTEAEGPIAAHTVLDRPLFRAGETVSMKHFVRGRAGAGLRALDPAARPTTARLVHRGGGQAYTTPIAWEGQAATSTWAIPRDARLGEYEIELRAGGAKDAPALASGSFRVEQFRVPLMRAQLKGPSEAVVDAATVTIDAQLAYLAGGPAANLPVRVRSNVAPRTPEFAGYDGWRFDASIPREGIESFAESGDERIDADRVETPVRTQSVTLDGTGGARIAIDQLPRRASPQTLQVELEYADPNGQLLSVSTRIPLLPSALHLGMRTSGYRASRDRLAFRVVALDPQGKAVAGRAVTVEAWERRIHVYRKRLLGGFYGYEESVETRRAGPVCKGTTDANGLLHCDGAAPTTGRLVLVARAADDRGRQAVASIEQYVAGGDDWFGAGDSDRIDLVADKRAYRPGETARIEVRMPFREATALVSVEREGILETRVQPLSIRSPFVEVPMLARYAPNAYVSVMVVRGRIDPEVPGRFAWLKRMVYRVAFAVGLVKEMPREVDTRPTAMVDLTKPAFRLGVAALQIGWDAHRLAVTVEPERTAYRVRETAMVNVRVTDAAGAPAANAEVALAAVDEGLLALKANTSWNLLEAMMQTRELEVDTSTAQSQVIGRRHFGRKAVAAGGGGGAGAGARELFDTLLAWHPTVKLDADGRARIAVPLNDSLTSFRIAAVAHAGEAQFGTGSASIRATQDLMLFAGLPPVVREGDRFAAMLTVRNAADRALDVGVAGTLNGAVARPSVERLALAPGEARTVSFATDVPLDATKLDWTFGARAGNDTDTLKATQRVVPVAAVRVYQQTLVQLDAGAPLSMPVALPGGATPGRGGIDVRLAASVVGDLTALRTWMQAYPYTCLEQRVSRAVALEDETLWQATMGALPAFVDRDGLVRYFATDRLQGDEVLTAYLLAIAHASGRGIPEAQRQRLLDGLAAFVEGRVRRAGALPTADLALRKLAAIDALSRYGAAKPAMLESIEIAPTLWPTSALLDWIGILQRVEGIPRRAERLAEARNQLRQRMDFSGTALAFSTERDDHLWWLMVSPDVNAARAPLVLLQDPTFREDMARLVRGAVGRQRAGRWSTTTANAWGVVALRQFARTFEATPPAGTTRATLREDTRSLEWTRAGGVPPAALSFPWPVDAGTLQVAHQGPGRPWAFVQSRAALPLTAPIAAGFVVKRSVTPVQRRASNAWSRGDTYRVTLEIEAGADRTWVVVDDPVPAGATILGGGLGGDARLAGAQTPTADRAALAFEERTFEGYRAYYQYVPKGRFSVTYTVRLDNPGRFALPASRVEAMYAPEVHAETPVAAIEVSE